MNRKQTLPVLIVGGGIGGITLSLALAKKKIASIVLERAPHFREMGAGILLCPNVFKMFEYLNLLPQMVDIASFPERLVYADGISGFEFLNIPMGRHIVERFGYPYGSFHRRELLRVLVQECEKSSYITLIPSAKVVYVEEKSGSVIAKTEDHAIYQGEALVGCDGLWSTVRKHVINNSPPRMSGHITHRGVVPIQKLPKHLTPHHVVHWDRPDGHMVQYPIGKDGYFNIVAVYKTNKEFDPENSNGDPEELQERFQGSHPSILELLSHIDTSKKWMLYDREPEKKWSKGRLALLGDSAHPTLPHLTQGAGMAIEDAVLLADRISDFDLDYEAAFQAYENERYLRTAHIQIFSRYFGEIHHLDGVAKELKNFQFAKNSLEDNYKLLGMTYEGIDVKPLQRACK